MSIWLRMLLVGGAGGLGAICRYLIQLYARHHHMMMGFDTLIINTIACALMGIFAGYLTASPWSTEGRNVFMLLTMTGFCGGFSTFSAFTLDCVKYYENGQVMTWIIFGTLTVFVGLFACALGYWIGHRL